MDTGDASTKALKRTIELARIPAPTSHEAERAGMVEAWWREDGLRPIADSYGNVFARIRTGERGTIVVCAHLDTVFDTQTEHRPAVDGNRLTGPSVGDDSVGVASLSLLDRLLPEVLDHSVWILATVGEEGVGNLAGIRGFLDDPPEPVSCLIAVEGNYLGRVVHTGIGVVRLAVTVRGPGGHSWEASAAPNAVHEVAKMICGLEQIRPTTLGRWSLNVGSIEGGEGINIRASRAEFALEFRAEDPAVLAEIESQAVALIESAPQLSVEVSETGRRPAGSIPSGHVLVDAAVRALAAVGLQAEHPAASTDANASYERGIPAISLGVAFGGGEHTPDEWIETSTIGDGLHALATTIALYSESAR